MHKQPTVALLPILEHDSAGRHRIVLPAKDGTFSVSDWQPVETTIEFFGYYSPGISSGFPLGICRIREAAYRSLPAAQ